MIIVQDKIRNSIFGFVIGDTMGVPIQYKKRDDLIKQPVTEMLGYGTYDISSGVYSGYTALLFATFDSIVQQKEIDVDDMAKRYCDYMTNGAYSATGVVLELDKSLQYSFLRFMETKKYASNCGSVSESSNYALLRMLPVAIYTYCSKLKDHEIIEIVGNVSGITNQNDISIMGCYLYIKYIHFLLNGKDKFACLNMIKLVDYSMFSDECKNAYQRIFDNNFKNLSLNDIHTTKNIVDTLEASLWTILNTDTFAQSIIGSINLGDDTSGVGAITGSIAGFLYSYEDIPTRWITKLMKTDYIDEISTKFSRVLQLDTSM